MLMVLVARCSLKSVFFVTCLVTITVKERLVAKGPYFPKYGTVISQQHLFSLLGRLLLRRDYRSIIITQVNHHNISPP